MHARLALPSSLFLHICCSSTDGLCSEMICDEMLSRPLLACLRVQLMKDKKKAKKFKTCYRLVFVPSFSNKFSCFPPPFPLQAVITVEAGVATALPLHTGKICEGSQEHWKKKKSSRSLCFGCYPRKKKKVMLNDYFENA